VIGEWFLKLVIRVQGENGVGDTVDTSQPVLIPLFSKNEADAEQQVSNIIERFKIAAKGADRKFFKEYCNIIDDEDGLSFSDFELTFLKKLDFNVPHIVGGP